MNKPLPKSVRIYALSVCFASMLVGSISLSIAVYDTLQYSFPETMHPQIKYQLQSAMQTQQLLESRVDNPQISEEQKEALSQQLNAIESSRPQQFGYNHFKARALESLIGSSITLFVSCLVFLFHWRLATRYEYNDDA
ncbi:MAG: hypothetical protein ACFHXK_00750 [bacterium]